MVKTKSTLYVCDNCGEEFIAWEGKCRVCGTWNSLKKIDVSSQFFNEKSEIKTTFKLVDISSASHQRLLSKMEELDRVLGGGIVYGSVILLGGDPGIGKSTLLLQLAAAIAQDKNQRVIYISGEESLGQIKIRAMRMNLQQSDLEILNETSLPNILATINQLKPTLVIIDSIQTIHNPEYPSTPGSIVQVRECSLSLQRMAKSSGISVILVGHITKEGVVAGPKTLEHLVDTVLYLEGEKYHNIRILRGVKNRFGDISESGIFSMQSQGLVEIKNPSEIFLSEKISAPGSVITVTLEGRRPILVEVQALVKRTNFGYPKRAASGYDLNRLQLLVAVLERRAGINLDNDDIYINIVGGIKVKEPAIDLAIHTAIASAKKNIVVDDKLVVWGEVGLSGEIRKVLLEEERSKEVKKLNYHQISMPKTLTEFLQLTLKV